MKTMFLKLGRLDLYNNPEGIKKEDVNWVKTQFLNIMILEREEWELQKPLVKAHYLINFSPLIEPYLKIVTNPFHRWLLTRLRFDLIYLLLGDSSGW